MTLTSASFVLENPLVSPGRGWDVKEMESVHAEDRAIVLRIASGDGTAEEDLVRRFQPGLLAIARVRAGRECAPDLVQETLTAALQNLRRGEWRGEGPLAAYLAAILRRLIIKGRAPRPVPEDATAAGASAGAFADPQTSIERGETGDRVREALARLAPRHREVLLLHYLEERTVEEIALGLEIPRGTVLSRLHHARRKMARILSRRPGGRRPTLNASRVR